MTETPDLLRIIAGEPERLSQQDRESIRLAVREFELLERHAALANSAVAELHQQMAALMERNNELQKLNAELQAARSPEPRPLAPNVPWNMGFRFEGLLNGYLPS